MNFWLLVGQIKDQIKELLAQGQRLITRMDEIKENYEWLVVSGQSGPAVATKKLELETEQKTIQSLTKQLRERVVLLKEALTKMGVI